MSSGFAIVILASFRPCESCHPPITEHRAVPVTGYFESSHNNSEVNIGTLSITVWVWPSASVNSHATIPGWHSSTNLTIVTFRSGIAEVYRSEKWFVMLTVDESDLWPSYPFLRILTQADGLGCDRVAPLALRSEFSNRIEQNRGA